ncbi:restriction endonuclease subunit S [Glaesserella parasuis]|nr:restriction endonuclease subunit S [Glaesserella parasuis]
MSSWKEYKLGEIATFYNGRAYKNTEFKVSGTPIVRIQNLTGEGKIVYSDLNLDENKYIDYGDLIYAWSATFGPYIWKGEKSIYHYHIWKIICNEELLDKKYFYYKLKQISDNLKDSGGNGSIFVHITKAFMENFKVKIPSLNEQKRVSSILAYLDEKIQLNTQINQTLEQIAQTIFKSWFIDFDPVHAKANALASGQTLEQATQAAMAVISGKNTQELHRLQTANLEQYQQLWEIAEAFPSGFDEEGVPWGWEERELSYLFEFLSGAQPPKSEHIYEEKEGYERFIQNRDYSNDNHKTYIPISKKNKRCTEKDILMDKYGEAGKVRYGIKGAYNVALAKIVPQKDNLREFLRSYFTQDKIRNYLSSSSMASTRNSLNSTTFTRMKVIVPNDFLLSTFDKLANEKIDKILQIKQENIELSKLRDYLLPKLLSGEV